MLNIIRQENQPELYDNFKIKIKNIKILNFSNTTLVVCF